MRSRSQPFGRNTEENPLGCYPSPHSFPSLQSGSAVFLAYVNPKMNRPTACACLWYLLLDQYYLYMSLARRFEFEPDRATKAINGKVGERFGQSYLERMSTEQFSGKRWKATLHRVVVTRQGREPSERFTLLELDEIETGRASVAVR